MKISKIEIIFTLVMITIIGSTLLYTIYEDNRIAKEVKVKYSRILIEDSIDGIVKSTFPVAHKRKPYKVHEYSYTSKNKKPCL